VFTEIVPRAGYRTMTVPCSALASAPTPSSSLLERRLAGRPDLEVGSLRHLRDSLSLAIPSRQVSDSVFFFDGYPVSECQILDVCRLNAVGFVVSCWARGKLGVAITLTPVVQT
jgi:hypothetical protein